MLISTGVPGQKPLAVAKKSIVGIKLIPMGQIVGCLNVLGPWDYLSRFGQATIAYMLESHRQWNRVFSTMRCPPWT